MPGDADVHGRGAVVVRHALAVDQLPHAAGVDRALGDVARGHRGDGPGEAPAVAVEHRQRPEVGALGREPGHDDLGERVQVRAAVRVDDALGRPRRARRVVDRDRLLLVLEPARGPLGRARGEELLVGVVRPAAVVDAHDVQRAQVERRELRRQRVVDEQRARARVAQDEVDLSGSEARVDGDQHAAGERHGVVRLEHGRGVGREHGDAIAMRHPARAQRVGEPVAALLELPVGQPPAVLVRDRDARRVEVGGTLQEGDGRQLAAIDLAHTRTSTHR